MLRRHRAVALTVTGLLTAGTLVSGCSAKSDEAVAWAGTECVEVANVYISTRLLASLVPQSQGIDDDGLALFQAQLSDAVSAVSSAVVEESTHLATVPDDLSGDVGPIQSASAAVTESMKKAGPPIGALAGAADAALADQASAQAVAAANDLRDTGAALAAAVAEVTAGNDTFKAASYCASAFADPGSPPTAVPSS